MTKKYDYKALWDFAWKSNALLMKMMYGKKAWKYDMDSALRFLRPYPFPHPSFRDSGYRYKIWNHSHLLISLRELIAFPPRIANPVPTSAPGHSF